MAWQAVMLNKVNCLEPVEIRSNHVIEWTDHDNDTKIIETWLFPTLLLNYIKINQTHYQWCGPVLMILQYLSKFTNTR